MATRKKAAPRKRGATNQRSKARQAPARRGVPGWLWALCGLVAGFLISQHQHGTAPWQDADNSPVARVEPQPADEQAAAEDDEPSASQDEPERTEPAMPTFEFYTLLPESEVVAPGGNMPESTATPPSRDQAEQNDSGDDSTADSDSQAPADDPIAQVIAANTTQPSEPDDEQREVDEDGRYMLQAASFRTTADARKLANRLKDFGLLANITEVKTGDGATWHRVQAGPYTDRNELSRAQDLMVTQGIEPLLIQLQN
ncbi:SPOR domain-containing protein [Halomonas sp. 18H]|uniref:SPOR domain-containing protein n=1 Tax=Halomonas almeriensis TaxID=308163 RepID=UPI002232C70E|nr:MULTISPECIES: SPOR domain-containing protein [Halomonas]MCW4149703.1 SPOR domain-containing protein [Halomonas sp. 18H]MDN3553352.1 SPOR domain-containing protein [Halomonas almeriensis]